MKKRLISILMITLLCLSLLMACSSSPADDGDDGGSGGNDGRVVISDGADEERFDALLDELFADWVTTDTITMQVFLADPDALGLERPPPTYGEVVSPGLFEKEREETAYIRSTLDNIEYENLSGERQIIYDTLQRITELSVILEAELDYEYYTGYVRPLTGIQVQLPILLAEFSFYSAQDIERYLELLADTTRYFDDIIEFERERVERGYFLNDDNLDEVLEQIEAFLENRGDSFLITVVNDKIDEYPGLTDEQREEYKKRNGELVLGNVLVAYDNLLEALRSFKGAGPNPGGLAALPDGMQVAHARIRLGAGTDKTENELLITVSRHRDSSLQRVREILARNDELMEKYINSETGQIPPGTHEEYLEILQEAIRRDFPPVEMPGYSVLEVHKSLQEHMSPAMFMVPAVDRYDKNVIYVNPSGFGDSSEANLQLFTVLAHEGFPGHMYETVYSRQKSPHPIRVLLSNNGYSEGWATYAEHMSYSWAGLERIEAELMHEMNLYFLLLRSHIDIGVHLFGWGIDEVAGLLYDDLGIEDPEAAKAYFNSVTGMPLNISMYALGYVEIMELREQAEKTWGDDYSLPAFHSFLLDKGPAPFPVISKHLR